MIYLFYKDSCSGPFADCDTIEDALATAKAEAVKDPTDTIYIGYDDDGVWVCRVAIQPTKKLSDISAAEIVDILNRYDADTWISKPDLCLTLCECAGMQYDWYNADIDHMADTIRSAASALGLSLNQ